MGPTCAKRATLGAENFTELQLNFIDDPANSVRPKKLTLDRPAKLPKSLSELHVLAKIAFDELMREFRGNDAIKYGEPALHHYQSLMARNVDCYSFGDPTLHWLEPEHNIHLLVDHDERLAYYWRIFNGTYTLLSIDPSRTAEARKNISIIRAYSEAMAALRENEAEHQLSLLDLT